MKHHNKWMDGQWMTYNTNREDFIHENDDQKLQLLASQTPAKTKSDIILFSYVYNNVLIADVSMM